MVGRLSIEQCFTNFEMPATTTASAVDYLDRKLGSSTTAEYSGIDFTVPPVADYVFAYSAKNYVNLVTAINEIRSSNNAVRFRKWCAEIDGELANEGRGRASLGAMQKLLRELEIAESRWSADINEHVKYVPREISLRKIWGIGPILQSAGLSTLSIRDPILWSSKPHLLFLNDLYQTV